ncbi:peptidoglycan/xylan/chitin deacetylase (PgdA/CDA1 family) [Humitalea rosea]|uniref:Chitooligosaccharide deacetylase n=1 Tax=Humitalea rosea TaxID=990373 RepID=A0A2W7I3J2_9PROT|nr:polysaccharide deacetylase family protein [Humitalea rosea]PZW39805.1 peptidoglycan/xylan/chitin deacetylase (PgdA/CDA1 family) [Humitalea rosea]
MLRRGLLGAAGALLARPVFAQPRGAGTLYLTIDTGWGREAEQIAALLRERQIPATLFLADEPTFRGDRSLGPGWAPFWQARAAEGHAFASHTWRHWYFSGDTGRDRVRFASRRSGEGSEVLTPATLCAELEHPIQALRAMVPHASVLPLWRAPGGRVTPNAIRMARACGLTHQGWTSGGFLGDELESAAHPNAALLSRALGGIRDGEVLVMHWGVRSRRDPMANVFGAMLDGLLHRGFRFALLPPQGIG